MPVFFFSLQKFRFIFRCLILLVMRTNQESTGSLQCQLVLVGPNLPESPFCLDVSKHDGISEVCSIKLYRAPVLLF